MAMAEFLYWQGRFEDALEAFRRVIKLTPDNARAYLLMAATMNYLGNTEASLRPLLKSIELSPNRGAYRDLGLTYTDLGEYEKAAEAFRRAVELGPDDHWSWGSLAKIYSFLEGQEDASRAAYAKAAELASAVLERNERDWLTLARLAMYNVMSGVVEDGVKRITIAVDEGPHLSEVHYLDAAIHSQLGRQEQALDALERAIKLGSPVQMIARDPQFADLRDDDRFKSLIDER
jgi:serine/threonine-protein kinase